MYQSSSLGLVQRDFNLRRRPLVDYSTGNKNRATIIPNILDLPESLPVKTAKTMARRRRRYNKRKKKVGRPRIRKRSTVTKRRRSGKKRVRMNRGRLVMNVPGYGVQRIPAVSLIRQVPIAMIRRVAKRIASQSTRSKIGKRRTRRTRIKKRKRRKKTFRRKRQIPS